MTIGVRSASNRSSSAVRIVVAPGTVVGVSPAKSCVQVAIRRHAEISIFLRMVAMPSKAKRRLIAFDLLRRTPDLRGRPGKWPRTVS